MSLRSVPASLALLLGGAFPALAATTPADAAHSCFRPDLSPPGKSLVTVRVIRCLQARQIAENDAKPARPEAPRTASD